MDKNSWIEDIRRLIAEDKLKAALRKLPNLLGDNADRRNEAIQLRGRFNRLQKEIKVLWCAISVYKSHLHKTIFRTTYSFYCPSIIT